MPIKVELRRRARDFVRHECSPLEREAFFEQLHKVHRAPLENTEPFFDPRISGYMLRFFRFRANIAIIEYHPADDRLYVRECRKLPPKLLTNPARPQGP